MEIIISFSTAFILNKITIKGSPIEAIKFVWDIKYIVIILICGIFVNAFCWVIRVSAMKFVATTAVAVIMPFSAVITAIASVIAGLDQIGTNLIVGAIIGFVAMIVSGVGDAIDEKKKV